MSKLVAISYRVSDLAKSIEYYDKHFGMKLTGKNMVGFGGGTFLQLEKADQGTNLGTGFGHFAIASDDIYAMCNKIKEDGGNVTRQPGPVLGGKTEIAFVEAPEGFKFELIQRGDEWKSKLLHLMLRVGDLEITNKFYSEGLGLNSIRKSENEQYKYTLEFLGYDSEENSTVFEFTYNWGKTADQYELGDAYIHTVLGIEKIDEKHTSLKTLGFNPSDITSDSHGRKFEVKDPTGYSLLCYESSAVDSWINANTQ